MRYFNIFGLFNQSRAEQKISINSEHSIPLLDEGIRVDMTNDHLEENKNESIGSINDRLQNISEKLTRHAEQEKNKRRIKIQTKITLTNFSLAGVSVYGLYRLFLLLQTVRNSINQTFENYYHEPIDGSNCYQITHRQLLCQKSGPPPFDSLIHILQNPLTPLSTNATQICQQMSQSYCDLMNEKTGYGAAVFFVVVALTTSVVVATKFSRDLCVGNPLPSCLSQETQFLARNVLDQDDLSFLIRHGILVNLSSTVATIIDEIQDEKIKLPITSCRLYSPRIFNDIISNYLDSRDSNDLDARNYMASFK